MREFSAGDALSEGWRLLKENYGVLVGSTLVYFALNACVSVIPILGALASLVITPPLYAGLLYVGVAVMRGEAEVGMIFQGFKRLGPTLGIYYLVVFVSIFAMIPAGVAVFLGIAMDPEFTGPAVVAIAIGTLITFILFMFIGIRWGLALPICLDQDLGVMASLGQSWNLTGRHFWALVGLVLCVCVINFFLLLLLYLPLILLGIPLTVAVMGATYGLLIGDQHDEYVAEVFD